MRRQPGLVSNSCLLHFAWRSFSFDHSIRPRQHIRWNLKPDLLRGFEIDDQIEFAWLLYWQVSRLCTLENFVYIDRCASIQVRNAHAVTHEPTRIHLLCSF